MDDFFDDTYHVKIMETKAMKNIKWAMPLALFPVKFNVSSYI